MSFKYQKKKYVLYKTCIIITYRAGGGKGIIVAPQYGHKYLDPEFRREVFMDFGEFLSSLNGCMSKYCSEV